MGTIITFINEKGGVGKTSTAFNLAWAFAEKGKKILLVDLDGQRANLTYFCGIRKDDAMLTMYDVLFNGKALKNAIVSVRPGVDLVPANSAMASLPQNAKVAKFRNDLRKIAEQYDFVFIDVNPTPGRSHVLSLGASDYALIILLPDLTSLEGNLGIIESIQEIKEFGNPDLQVLGLLFNKNENRTNLAKAVKDKAEQIAALMNSSVFETKIRNAVVLGENVNSHIGITEYYPSSPAAQDILSLADEMMTKLKQRKA